jgi:hypothetical protein
MQKQHDLNQLSQQLGIKLKQSESGELSSEARSIQPTPPQETAAIVQLDDDNQRPESNPLFKWILLGSAIFATLGVGLIVLLWGAGDNTQPAKKPDTLPVANAGVQTPDQQKEIADLKAKLVMEQQKLEASRLKAAAITAPTASQSPTPTAKTGVTQPTQDPAQQAAIDRNKQQQTQELASLASAKQQQQSDLTNLARVREQQTSQVMSLRRLQQQEGNKLGFLNRARQQVTAELTTLIARTKKERQNLDALIKQSKNTKVAGGQVTPTKNQALASVPGTKEPELSWDQAVLLGSYGGSGDIENVANNNANPNGSIDPTKALALTSSPLLRLPVGQVVGGRLATPFYTLISNGDTPQQSQKSTVSITLDKAIAVGSGWNLPVGTAIEFEFQVADNGMIQATSKKVTYGNTEIQIPSGAFSLLGNDNQPLFAQIKEVNTDKLASADLRSAIFGGAAEVGNVLVNSGNSSSVSIGAGTAIATTNNGSPNIVGAIFKGAFSPLAQTQVTRAQTIANRLDKQSKVGYLLPGTTMRVYVAQPATFQIPTETGSTQLPNPMQIGNGYVPTTSNIALTYPAVSPTATPTSAYTQPTATTTWNNPYTQPTTALTWTNPYLQPVTPTITNPYTQPTTTSTWTNPYIQPIVTPTATNPTPAGSPVASTPTDPNSVLRLDTTQGQLTIISPRGIPVQAPPVQLPTVPASIPSIFPR